MCRGNQRLIKIWQESRYFTWRRLIYVFIISLPVLLRRRDVSDKSCRENRNTFYIQFILFRKFCRVWDNVEKYRRTGATKRSQMTIWRMRIACCIPKVTNKHSEYVTFNYFFPLQQWLPERASMLRYKHIACIIGKCIGFASEILHCHVVLY